MCVAVLVIHTKTLEKKSVDDVVSTESVQLHEPASMSQGTALFSCGIMESGRWPEVCGVQPSLWDSVRGMGAGGGISGLLHDLSLSEASSAPPGKRQRRSVSCSSWRPQGSHVWTTVEKRRCLSGGGRPGSGRVFLHAAQRSAGAHLPPRGFTRLHPRAAPQTETRPQPITALHPQPPEDQREAQETSGRSHTQAFTGPAQDDTEAAGLSQSQLCRNHRRHRGSHTPPAPDQRQRRHPPIRGQLASGAEQWEGA